MADVKSITLKNVRLSFPSLWKKAVYEGKEKGFEATFLMPKESPQAKRLETAAKKFAEEKFGKGKVPKALKYTCLVDGDTKDYDGYEDMLAFKGASTKRFPIVDTDKTPLAEEDGYPEAGDYVNAVISFWYSDHPKGGKQILGNIGAIQFVKEGEHFSSVPKVDVDDVFDDLSGEEEEEDY